jgi:protein disulfide-isomerase-like protein
MLPRTLVGLVTLLVPALAQDPEHVLVLHDSPEVALKDVLGVFSQKLGVGEAQAMPLVQRIKEQGSSVVLMSSEANCQKIAAMFEEIKMKATVRAKQEGDVPKAPPGEYEGSNVQQLDAAQFKSQVYQDDSPPYLMAFYAPWCGPCRAMVPEFKQAARQLAKSGVTVAAVDCDANREIAQLMSIKGYPTVAFVNKGKATLYNGPRKAQEIASFATQQHTAARLKSAVVGVASGAVSGAKKAFSKIGLSKLVAPAAGAVAATT